MSIIPLYPVPELYDCVDFVFLADFHLATFAMQILYNSLKLYVFAICVGSISREKCCKAFGLVLNYPKLYRFVVYTDEVPIIQYA